MSWIWKASKRKQRHYLGFSELADHLAAAFGPTLPSRRADRDGDRAARLKTVLGQMVQLKLEGLALFQALPLGAAFRRSEAKYRVARGSNRSSKTMTGCVEMVEAWTGCGVPGRYPKYNGNSLVVGLDLDHIAMFWRKCGQPGAFRVIRDERTKLTRAVRPDPNDPHHLDPYDLAYCEKWRDAPPLLPPRAIADISWEDKRQGIPRLLTTTTNWHCLFRSSEGSPPQGDAYHLGLLDEEMRNPQFYYEMCRGLVGLDPRYKPRGIWTATAQIANPELAELEDRAAKGEEEVESFDFLIGDNPYISDKEREAFAASLPEEEREVRIFGAKAVSGRLAYPMFDAIRHTCEPFEIPDTWTRFVVVDYGLRHCATIFIAIDPEERHAWVYDGFDLRQSDAVTWAKEVKIREGATRFEAFVGDAHMGKEGRIGSGESVAECYWAALKAEGITPRLTGSDHLMAGFFPGMDVIPARTEAVIAWMRVRESGPFRGTPILQIFRGKIPLLEKQIKRAQYEDATRYPDRANKRRKMTEDLLVTLEYGAAFKPYYQSPEPIKDACESSAFTVYQKLKERREQHRDLSLYH